MVACSGGCAVGEADGRDDRGDVGGGDGLSRRGRDTLGIRGHEGHGIAADRAQREVQARAVVGPVRRPAELDCPRLGETGALEHGTGVSDDCCRVRPSFPR